MPNFGVWEWLVILVIVLVIFGASRLRGVGQGLGGAINAFRSEVKKGREEEEAKEVESLHLYLLKFQKAHYHNTHDNPEKMFSHNKQNEIHYLKQNQCKQ